jgi:hypothetical protein
VSDPKTKEQSKELRHSHFQSLKKFKTSKALASVFWNKDGILIVNYLERSATITAKYYYALLDKLKQQVNIEASFRKEFCFFKTMLLFTRLSLHTRK